MTVAKSATERKAAERERKRSLGLVPGEVWAHPQDWPDVRRYVERKTRKRAARLNGAER